MSFTAKFKIHKDTKCKIMCTERRVCKLMMKLAVNKFMVKASPHVKVQRNEAGAVNDEGHITTMSLELQFQVVLSHT